MAGPLSTEEIEDVVSSVRRLVSNEQSSRSLSRDLGADRLLLTPSLRVVSETSPLAPLVLDTPDPVTEAFETAAPEPVVEPEPAIEPVELIEADWEDEIWAAPEAVSLGEVALAAEEAEVLLPSAVDMPDVLAPEPDDLPETWGEEGSDWAEDEPVPFVPLRRRAETLAAKLAAGDVIDTPAPREAEPEPVAKAAPVRDVDPALYENLLDTDLPIAGDVATVPSPEADRMDPDEQTAAQSATHRMPTEILDSDGTPLAVLDEAALQEIVRQMIREELQGTLGERITRNVRKLVRAEINRALVARDLD